MHQTTIYRQDYTEIFSVRARFSQVACSPAFDSTAGTFWTPGDPVTKSASELASALKSTLGSRFGVGNALRIFTRIVECPDSEGRHDAFASVMYHQASDMNSPAPQVLIAAAARFAAAMVDLRSLKSTRTPLAILDEAESPWPLSDLMTTPLASLLGTKIPIGIIARVPGRAPLLLEERFARVPSMQPTSTVIVMRGKLLGTKESGRSRTLGVDGACVATHRLAKLPKVAFDEIHRTAVSAAVAEPWRKVELNITVTHSSSGRAKPETSYKLNSLRFV